MAGTAQGFKQVKAGDAISAAGYNEIVQVLASMLRSSGANFYVDSQGLHVRSFPPQATTNASVWKADAATTANHALTGTANVDDVTLTDGSSYVMVWKQNTASQNGLYKVVSAGWQKVGQPDIVFALNGTVYGGIIFRLASANTYKGNGAMWG